MMWLDYFDPTGESPDRSDFLYVRSLGATPSDLGNSTEPWIRGYATSASFHAHLDLSAEIPALSDCAGFTEPALISRAGQTHLATSCVVIEGGVRREDKERIVLLKQQVNGYNFIGNLLDAADAARLNADRLEQADLSISSTGQVLLIVTPINTNADPAHQGCVVFEVEDLQTAKVRRDGTGRAVEKAILTADGNGLGPGLCTYDAASATGVLMVITTQELVSNPPNIVFSLRATGVKL
jgi:hypothetical protein